MNFLHLFQATSVAPQGLKPSFNRFLRVWAVVLGTATLTLVGSSAQAASFSGLGDLPGGSFSSNATAVSADGSVVVGSSRSSNGLEAFRWEAGNMVGLGTLSSGFFSSTANGVSADGSVVVGHSNTGLFGTEAFRWEAGNMVGLGHLTGGGVFSFAHDVSDNGSVVVGFSVDPNEEAFRWEAGNMVGRRPARRWLWQ